MTILYPVIIIAIKKSNIHNGGKTNSKKLETKVLFKELKNQIYV